MEDGPYAAESRCTARALRPPPDRSHSMDVRPESDPFASRHDAAGGARDAAAAEWGPIVLARARAARSRNGSARCVADASGTWWVISEQPSPAAQGNWCLVFEADETTLYVHDYPANWMLLDAERLTALGLAKRTND